VLALTTESVAQKSAVHWYLPTITVAQATEMKGYDLFIGDPEVFFTSPDAIAQLRIDNPEIQLVCYVKPVEWFVPMYRDKPWSLRMVTFLKTIPQWWLTDSSGKPIVFWQGTQMVNCSTLCPRVKIAGKKITYIEFFSDAFINGILKKFQFDGVLIDEMWDGIFWLGEYGQNRSGVNANRDGRPDKQEILDPSWKKGIEFFARRIRAFGGKDFLMFGNPANMSFLESVDGKMFENFPDIYVNESDRIFQAWFDNLNRAASMKLAIFNAREDNYFFTLCSAVLLDNVYFSYVQNTAYDPKWNLDLGEPLGPCVQADADGKKNPNGEHAVRKFENSTVFVHPRAQTSEVVYEGGITRRE